MFVGRNQVFPVTWQLESEDDPTLALTSQLAKLSVSNETSSPFLC